MNLKRSLNRIFGTVLPLVFTYLTFLKDFKIMGELTFYDLRPLFAALLVGGIMWTVFTMYYKMKDMIFLSHKIAEEKMKLHEEAMREILTNQIDLMKTVNFHTNPTKMPSFWHFNKHQIEDTSKALENITQYNEKVGKEINEKFNRFKEKE